LAVQSGPSHQVDTVENAVRWADRAHSRMTELFESSITDLARHHFEERRPSC
jgi:hypothetical protein